MLTGAATLAGCAAPPPHGPRTDHFDGAHFFNPDGEQGTGGEQREGFGQLLRNLIWPSDRIWPQHVPVTLSRPPARVAGEATLVT